MPTTLNRIQNQAPASGRWTKGPALLAGIAGLCLACSAAPGQQTTDMVLTAQVRDFDSAHTDFCQNHTVGSNWVEGSVASQLSAQGRPVYTGAGRRILTPATDADGNPISNSLIAATIVPPIPAVVLGRPASMSNNPTIDTYNPALGAYGGSNVGTLRASAPARPCPPSPSPR